MAYFLIGNHGALAMAGDPSAPRLPLAIGPGDDPLLEIDLVVGEDPAERAGVEVAIELQLPEDSPPDAQNVPEEIDRGVAVIDVMTPDEA